MSPSERRPIQCGHRAFAVLRKLWDLDGNPRAQAAKATPAISCSPTRARRVESLCETPFDIPDIIENIQNDPANKSSTVLYLAYGSNLSAETFQGNRGIKPISQMNVLVPSLELTFDLAGIPYIEPCFANTRYRTLDQIHETSDYHKDRWKNGLVGVVYEVTKADYAVIIATEGGGASYKDVLVDCFEIPTGTEVVDPNPHSAPIKAHTLLSPAVSEPGKPHKGRGRVGRPDPSYAQASSRYLKLITDGAAEHNLPRDYQAYLNELRPYVITNTKQQVGKVLIVALWAPIIAIVFILGRIFADKNGRIPKWLAALMGAVFSGVWMTYDLGFKKLFGDGERTQEPENDEEVANRCSTRWRKMGCDEKNPLIER
jgi:hypothetical protein